MDNKHWSHDAIFYHIYPLGFCGAPAHNDFSSPATPRLENILPWLDHIQSLGVNAIYLGPLFESTSHGYDTADYFHVDRRLGTSETLKNLVDNLHQRSMQVVFDAVFNHVGRNFWAFGDLMQNGASSAYRDWFAGVDFTGHSPYNDPFTYQGWNGHYDLVKLNLNNPAVREHLFQAVDTWVGQFDIDGLRLDAADCLEMSFIEELAAHCRSLRDDLWLMGEIIHGDYRRWAAPGRLDSVTNYECYKGLYSSHVDKNYFEIAYSLNRQFGEEGLYRGLYLYNFADNHDVNRVASSLQDPAHLNTLYCLLFTMPGIPSIYYGSEWGIQGKKEDGDDSPLRPQLDLAALSQNPSHLVELIANLSRIRRSSQALRYGNYHQLFVSHEQLAFARQTDEECVIVLVNATDHPVSLSFSLPVTGSGNLEDLLNKGEIFSYQNGYCKAAQVPAHWARILKVTRIIL